MIAFSLRINGTSLCELRLCESNRMELPSVHCHSNRPFADGRSTTIRCFHCCVVAVIVICFICTIRTEFLFHTHILKWTCARSRPRISQRAAVRELTVKILYYRRRFNKPSQMRNAGRTVHTLLNSGLTISKQKIRKLQNCSQDENWYDNGDDERKHTNREISTFSLDKIRIGSPSLLPNSVRSFTNS